MTLQKVYSPAFVGLIVNAVFLPAQAVLITTAPQKIKTGLNQPLFPEGTSLITKPSDVQPDPVILADAAPAQWTELIQPLVNYVLLPGVTMGIEKIKKQSNKNETRIETTSAPPEKSSADWDIPSPPPINAD